jgi:hypothetical protein
LQAVPAVLAVREHRQWDLAAAAAVRPDQSALEEMAVQGLIFPPTFRAARAAVGQMVARLLRAVLRLAL